MKLLIGWFLIEGFQKLGKTEKANEVEKTDSEIESVRILWLSNLFTVYENTPCGFQFENRSRNWRTFHFAHAFLFFV